MNSTGNGFDKSNIIHPVHNYDTGVPKYGTSYTWALLGDSKAISDGVLTVKAGFSLFTRETGADNPFAGLAAALGYGGSDTVRPHNVDANGDGRKDIITMSSTPGDTDIHLLLNYTTGPSAHNVALSGNAVDYIYANVSNGVVTSISRYTTEQNSGILLGKVVGSNDSLDSAVGTEYTRGLLSLSNNRATLKADATLFAVASDADNPFSEINGNGLRPEMVDLDHDGDLDLLLVNRNGG